MSKGLTAEQAASVVRTFAHFEYPDKEEGKDHRIPDASRFREWGVIPGQISHYMAVSLVGRSDHHHGTTSPTMRRLRASGQASTRLR